MAYETLLKSWGDPGVEWKDGWAFAKDEPLPAEWANFLFDNLITDVQHLVDLTNTIDSDNDGIVDNAAQVGGMTPDQLGGFGYVQTNTPEGNEVGASWYKDANNLLLMYDGDKYELSPDVGYDEVTDFGDSSNGFTVVPETPARVEITNGDVRLLNKQTLADFETSAGPTDEHWTSDGTTTRTTGTVLAGSASGEVVSVGSPVHANWTRDNDITQNFSITFAVESDTSNINDESGFDLKMTDNTVVYGVRFNDGMGNISDGNGNELQASWNAGQGYTFDFHFDWANDEVEVVIDGTSVGTFALQNTASEWGQLSIVNDASNSGVTRSVYFDDATEHAREYGEAVIVCPEPDARIEKWDVVRFDRALDGESVVIDVEDEAGNTLLSDITSNDDLSQVASSNTNPQIRVKFSRVDTSNNPALHSLYRRWTARPGDTGFNVHDDGTQIEQTVRSVEFKGRAGNVTKTTDGRVEVDTSHIHDDRYYTETETDDKFYSKTEANNRYYTKSQSNTRFLNVSGDGMDGSLNMNKNETVQFVLEKRTSDPSNAAVGQMWYRTDLD